MARSVPPGREGGQEQPQGQAGSDRMLAPRAQPAQDQPLAGMGGPGTLQEPGRVGPQEGRKASE